MEASEGIGAEAEEVDYCIDVETTKIVKCSTYVRLNANKFVCIQSDTVRGLLKIVKGFSYSLISSTALEVGE